jgi:Type IV secretion-system coupling protein DNA-binding domain
VARLETLAAISTPLLHALSLYVLGTAALALGLLTAGAPRRQFLQAPLFGLALALGLEAIEALLRRVTLNTLHVTAALTQGTNHALTGLPIGATVFAPPILGYVLGRLAARSRASEVHRRGARIRDGRPAQRQSARSGRDAVHLAGIAVPALDETKHFKLIGTTGTGKSTAIREVLRTALARGDRALIADPDGGYLERFYRPYRGDEILTPFDPRAVRWDLFAEVQSPTDADQLARSLIPDAEDAGAREWRAYARTFTAALIERTRADHKDTGLLWHRLAIAPTDELRPLLAGTAAAAFLEPANARMFGSVRSVTTSALASLKYIAAQRAPGFSVRHWVRPTGTVHEPSGNVSTRTTPASQTRAAHGSMPHPDHASSPTSPPRRALFIPYKAGEIAALKSVIATWLRLAIFEAMSGPEGDLKLWFIVDELDALGAIDGLKDALARLRKFGGRCVLGFQSIAQVSSLYGRGDAQTLVENCANTLIFRCSASEGGGTAAFASHLIGEREILRAHTSESESRDGGFLSPRRYSKTQSLQHVTEYAVMAAELEQLPDLTGYLKLASRAHWLRVDIRQR